VNQSHNGYLEVYLQVGIVGLVFLSSFILEFCGNIRRIINYDWGVFMICFLTMWLLTNYTEATFINSNLSWSMIVFLTIISSNLGLYSREA